MDNVMFIILGVALTGGGSVLYRGSTRLGVRSSAAAALAVGAVLLLIGLVNALSGTG